MEVFVIAFRTRDTRSRWKKMTNNNSCSYPESCKRRAIGFLLSGIILIGYLAPASAQIGWNPDAPYREPSVNRDEETFAAAREQQSPDTTSIGITNIRLNPGGNVSVAGSWVHSDSDVWIQQGAAVKYSAIGASTSSTSPSVHAAIDIELLEAGRGATHRSASAAVDLTYFVRIGRDPDVLPPVLGGMPEYIPVQLVSYAFQNAEPGADAVGSLELFNRRSGESLIAYTTDEDGSIASNSNDALERNYFLDNDEIRVGDVLEITLTADVFAVIDNSDGPDARTIASAEVYVDPFFLFDQAAFDAQRLLDPTLADIQLAEYFTFQVSSNIVAAAVPLPASLFLLGPVIGLLPTWRRRDRVNA